MWLLLFSNELFALAQENRNERCSVSDLRILPSEERNVFSVSNPQFDSDEVASYADIHFKNISQKPISHGVTYVGCAGLICQLFMQPLSGGKPVQLTHFDSEPSIIAVYAWSRDGKKFAITRQRAHDTDVVHVQQLPLLSGIRPLVWRWGK